ncbi:Methyltransferase-like protein-like protein [Hapsidospora chrysogenum ATCC 11550]|uniref:Methyltransferase-like protein-like protein n=1 Tax=Hapsidospora chrysogenum (strain ATCC 11550 / CBS 779.69 / DSM 880 / IAM 14645 / JCM 23072 / IMI 49137) TaxID=857340 RepID=A0A086T2X8_HAPC1|nr:Methyltransferase-like protein-like protein [Hapsidospora chrysogenum ATCC 11550]
MVDRNEDADHSGQPCRPSSILYESDCGTIVLLDIPRTLEESQALSSRVPPASSTRRIISAQPVEAPFDTPDPKCTPPTAATTNNPASHIALLMTAASVQSALDHLHTSYTGAFHLPRVVAHGGGTPPLPATGGGDPFIPEQATALHGSLQDLSRTLRDSAPAFDLIILDPPWPNRSARRRTDGYSTVPSLADMAKLLDHVPVPSHLAPSGLVAVWITNNASVLDFVTSRSGLFASWGLELVAEWTWLKVTASGEPIFTLDSAWRKPWEKLLIAKRVGAQTPVKLGSSSKTIIAVPDVHSRKPNLRGLFTDVLGPGFIGLEVFARNLTAGWWSWGDEVLQFQQPQHWVTSSPAEQ